MWGKDHDSIAYCSSKVQKAVDRLRNEVTTGRLAGCVILSSIIKWTFCVCNTACKDNIFLNIKKKLQIILFKISPFFIYRPLHHFSIID